MISKPSKKTQTKLKSAKSLKDVEKALDEDLKDKWRNGLSQSFKELGMKGVAKEIKAGRNVTGNVEYGIKFGLHSKLGPRYDPTTGKFYPMTMHQRELEHRFIELSNLGLKGAGYREVNPKIISHLRKGDRDFEKKVKERKK